MRAGPRPWASAWHVIWAEFHRWLAQVHLTLCDRHLKASASRDQRADAAREGR